MSAFLARWDDAIARAIESGRIAYVTDLERRRGMQGEVITAVVRARTMHPAFMAARPLKYDPERDQ